MAGHLLLLILMCFFHELKAQDLLPPNLTVNQVVIRETDSVSLNCQTPSSVSVSQCYFKFLRDKPPKLFSCKKTLSATELLSLVQQRSPATVQMTCFYLQQLPSPESNMLTITIRKVLPPKLTVNPLVITETDSVSLNCQPPSSVSVSQCYFKLRDKPPRPFSCLKILTGTELLSLAQQRSPATVEVTCSYLRQHQSTNSNMLTITIQSPQPKLIVNPQQLITETESVALICETPSSVSVSQCFLFFMRTKTSRPVSCLKALTGTELLLMSQQSSPAEVEVTCYYTVERGGQQHPSPHSIRSFISILKLTSTSPSTTTQEMTTQTITFLHTHTVTTVIPRSGDRLQSYPSDGGIIHFPSVTGSSSVSTSLSPSVKTTKDSLTSVDAMNPGSGEELTDEMLWTVGAAVTLSVIFLGFALLSSHSRIEKCASNGAKVNVVDDWKSLAGYDETHNIVTYEGKNEKCASKGAKVNVIDDRKSLAGYNETYNIVTYEFKNK